MGVDGLEKGERLDEGLEAVIDRRDVAGREN